MSEPSLDRIRVRFAPSPTGYLHVGGLRTALYNYLVARKAGGRMILRIEDTDRSRFVDDAEADIIESLAWAGLPFDEGPGTEGEAGPYRQSERSELYARHSDLLIEAGRAYYAFDTPEELEALRGPDASSGARYDAVTRTGMRNSLSMPESEWRALLDAGSPWVVRLKVEPGSEVVFDDAIRGRVSFATDTVDDQVLMKSDGMPTYHLANVVDDHFMAVTHVIRGEEWLPSTPKHILLYDAFGWTPPTMAHLPLIMSPSGGKLSKRSADRLGIPVMVKDYVKAGYEPSALINYLAFLGWNPGDDREVFSLEELIEAFSLERVGSAGVQFDMAKLAWYNQQHLKALPKDRLAARCLPHVLERYPTVEPAYVADVADLMRERLEFARDLGTTWSFFFADPEGYDEDGVRNRWKEDAAELVTAYADRLDALEHLDHEVCETALRELAEERAAGAGRIIHPVRLAVSGLTIGPGLFEMLALLGKEVCVRRLRRAAGVLGRP